MHLLVSPSDISPVRGLANIVFTLPHPLIYFFFEQSSVCIRFFNEFQSINL